MQARRVELEFVFFYVRKHLGNSGRFPLVQTDAYGLWLHFCAVTVSSTGPGKLFKCLVLSAAYTKRNMCVYYCRTYDKAVCGGGGGQ